MTQPTIQRYPFNSPSSLGLEVKPLTFLSEKAEKAGAIHRADFYLLLWVEEGRLSLSLDFEDVCIRDEEALLISPGQVVRFCVDSLPKGFAVLFVPEFVGEATSDIRLLHQLLGASLRGYKVSSLHGLPILGLMHQLMRELTAQESVYQLIIARSCLRILLWQRWHGVCPVRQREAASWQGGSSLRSRSITTISTTSKTIRDCSGSWRSN